MAASATANSTAVVGWKWAIRRIGRARVLGGPRRSPLARPMRPSFGYGGRTAPGAGASRALPIRGPGDEIVRWIGTNTDIEDQKSIASALADLNATLEQRVLERTGELMAAEEALRQSQKMEAVGQLTGGIAHDFNNMLAVVMGSLDLLSRRVGIKDPRARPYLEAASNGARRAAALTQRLLAFAQQQPLRPEPTNLNKLVAGMSDILRHSLSGDIRLETVLAGGDLAYAHRSEPA